MKKIILTLGIAALSLTGFAQLNAEEDGFTNNYTNASSNCNANLALPNNGGIMSEGNTLTASNTVLALQATGLVLTSVSEIPGGGTATWFSLPYTQGVGETASCSKLFTRNSETGINMSSHPRIKVTASANTDGATLEFYLGTAGQEWFAVTSTYNTGSGESIIASHTFATAGVEETFIIDLMDIDEDIWADWSGKSAIQSIGYRSATADAVFTVVEVQFGSVVPPVGLFGSVDEASFEVYPNPVSDVVNLGEAAINAVLYNAQGTPVFSAAKVEKIEVGTLGLEAGVYLLQAENGRAKIVVE